MAQHESDEPDARSGSSTASSPRLSWPPPGLEQLQGVTSPIIRTFSFGAALFALPLLISIGREQPFWSLGPFGRSYWIPAVTSLIAVGILVAASFRLALAIRIAARGAQLGYGIGTILSVAADANRDTGFVLQGARVFSKVGVEHRQNILATRMVHPLLFLAACLWIPAGLALAVLLAYLGAIGPGLVWFITLVPATFLAFLGWIMKAVEGSMVEGAKKRWRSPSALDQHVRDEATHWREQEELVASEVAIGSRKVLPPRVFKIAAALVIVPAVLLLIPVAAVISFTVMGPVLASLALPNVGGMEQRLRGNQLLTEYLVAVDSSITPRRAGQALNNMALAGVKRRHELEQPPTRELPEIGERIDLGIHISSFFYQPDSALVRLRAGGLTPKQRADVDRLINHPALEEFRVLAHAPGIEIVGTRYVTPLPETIAFVDLPSPKFTGIRSAGQAYALRGFAALADGRIPEAEQIMKEVISAGYRLAAETPFLIEAIVGSSLIGVGAAGLDRVYRHSGRSADADVLQARLKARDQIRSSTRLPHESDLRTGVQEMPRIAGDGNTSITLRWEMFGTFNTFANCLNLHRAIFRKDAEHDRWVEQVRQNLVRYKSDEALFEVMRSGMLGSRVDRSFRCGVPLQTLRELR